MLSQGVMYAAQALAVLANEPSRFMLVRNLASAAQVPAPYLSKIVQTLARKGLVTTQRGIGGGVSLARSPEDITIYDLCVALDDPIILQRCMLGTAECSDVRACPCHTFWSHQRTELLGFLRTMCVASMRDFFS